MIDKQIKAGNSTMIVARVVNDGDRKLIYDNIPGRMGYHVIADSKNDVKIGDQIEYEPYGANFGWFERVL